MASIIKNFIHYIKCLMSGEEYISPELKFIYAMHFFSFVHIVLTIVFTGFGIVPIVVYNVFSILFYQWMVSLCKSKHFLFAFAATYCEVMLFVLIASLSLGNKLGFSLYCLGVMPACFYTSYTVKKIRRSTLFSLLLSFMAFVVFIFCSFVPGLSSPESQAIPVLWQRILYIMNAGVTFCTITIFSLLFVWEMKNSNAILEKRNSQLTLFANRDPLTKLPNRRSMMEHLNLSMHKLQLDSSPFSIILGDIDDFKKINDVYGHDAGDKILVTVANIITSQMRENDYVCRWGGEEILIIINDNLERATMIAERIRSAIAATTTAHGAYDISVTMTFGVAPAIPGYRVEQIIQQADTKLYQGKANGKNQVVN